MANENAKLTVKMLKEEHGTNFVSRAPFFEKGRMLEGEPAIPMSAIETGHGTNSDGKKHEYKFFRPDPDGETVDFDGETLIYLRDKNIPEGTEEVFAYETIVTRDATPGFGTAVKGQVGIGLYAQN